MITPVLIDAMVNGHSVHTQSSKDSHRDSKPVILMASYDWVTSQRLDMTESVEPCYFHYGGVTSSLYIL